MRLCFLYIIITIFSGVFASTGFAQSIFSGLILSEKKEGLKVIDAQRGSPGFDAGLKAGDVVLEIDGKKIKTLDDYIKISKEANGKRLEASLTVLREGILYEAVVKAYSNPVYGQWKEKVAKPIELPRGLTNSPYEYWVDKGNRTLKEIKNTISFEKKTDSYNDAIQYLYNGLHHQPKSIDTALRIAELYHELGNLYLDNGIMDKGIKNYKSSIKLYSNCFRKTQEEDYLKLILANLQKLEKSIGEIETDNIQPLSDAKKEQ